MQYVYGYEMAALVFLFIIAANFFSARRFPSATNKLFGFLIIFAICDLALDLITAYMITYYNDFPIALNIAANELFYAVQMAFPALAFIYVLQLSGRHPSRIPKTMVFLLLPVVLSEVALVINIFNGMCFSITKESGYKHEYFYPVLFACVIFYLLAMIVVAVIKSKKIKTPERITIFSFVLLITGAMVLQALNPPYLITGLSISIAITLMYFTLQKPEDMLDSMTGVFSRDSFAGFLAEAFENRRVFQIITVDIEELKRVNKVFGNTIGNEVIKSVAIFLTQNSRHRWVFRLLGDRFAVATMDKSRHKKLLRDILRRFKKPFIIGDIELNITVTVCYIENISFVNSTEELLALFESAIPVLKKSHKGGFAEITQDSLSFLTRRSAVESALRTALETNGLEVWYQPIYSVEQKRFTCAEALLRLPQSAIGAISPGEFIPIAESTGLILRIDEFVIENVCAFISRNDLKQYGLESIDVNISGAEFLYERIKDKITDIVARNRIEPSFLVFEITETAATAANETLAEYMEEMNNIGFRFAVDDYGSGYANMSRVISLPFHTVKIDRSLLLAGFEGGSNALIFHDTLSMLKKLGMHTVIEGVETQEQLDFLNNRSVDYIQGFVFSRAVPPDEFIKLLKNQND